MGKVMIYASFCFACSDLAAGTVQITLLCSVHLLKPSQLCQLCPKLQGIPQDDASAPKSHTKQTHTLMDPTHTTTHVHIKAHGASSVSTQESEKSVFLRRLANAVYKWCVCVQCTH